MPPYREEFKTCMTREQYKKALDKKEFDNAMSLKGKKITYNGKVVKDGK